jgi:hypothetical protein
MDQSPRSALKRPRGIALRFGVFEPAPSDGRIAGIFVVPLPPGAHRCTESLVVIFGNHAKLAPVDLQGSNSHLLTSQIGESIIAAGFPKCDMAAA